MDIFKGIHNNGFWSVFPKEQAHGTHPPHKLQEVFPEIAKVKITNNTDTRFYMQMFPYFLGDDLTC